MWGLLIVVSELRGRELQPFHQPRRSVSFRLDRQRPTATTARTMRTTATTETTIVTRRIPTTQTPSHPVPPRLPLLLLLHSSFPYFTAALQIISNHDSQRREIPQPVHSTSTLRPLYVHFQSTPISNPPKAGPGLPICTYYTKGSLLLVGPSPPTVRTYVSTHQAFSYRSVWLAHPVGVYVGTVTLIQYPVCVRFGVLRGVHALDATEGRAELSDTLTPHPTAHSADGKVL